MKKTIFLTAAAAMLLLASCASYTRGELYPKFYEETPVSLLVMPPINNTTNVEAKDHLYTSISQPLVEAGYYVISPHLALEMLKAEILVRHYYSAGRLEGSLVTDPDVLKAIEVLHDKQLYNKTLNK